MTKSQLTEEQLAALIALPEALDYDPDHQPRKTEDKPWMPDLNPTQRLIWDDATFAILAYGEKYSGKTIGALKKMVRHCYENWDALAVLISPSIRTGKFGLVHDLETLILPEWEAGIGLEWLPSRQDPNTKDRLIKVGNRFGGWSTILQISIPYEEAIEARIKGINPSFVLVDELTDCNGVGYFRTIAAQLGRRRYITGPQQYIGTCNPKGPSNWVYQLWFEEAVNLETGERDPRFRVYHVPFLENAHRPEAEEYIKTLLATIKGDPIARARLIDGQWVEMPTGESLFKDFYVPSRHVIGNVKANLGIVPAKGFQCSIGYDIGQRYTSTVFLQQVEAGGKLIWLIFDEIIHLKEKILYRNLASEIVERMADWNQAVGTNLMWEHVSDDSAINQWRPGSGSYDAWEFEREFSKSALARGWPEMRMVGCPKGAGSVSARVRLVQSKLHTDQLLVSDTCSEVKEVLLMLAQEKGDEWKPKKDGRGLIHTFDAFSYPMLKRELQVGGTGPAVAAIHSAGT